MRLLVWMMAFAGTIAAQRMAPTFPDLQTFLDVCPQNDPYYSTIRRDFLITRDGVEVADPMCVEPYTKLAVADVTEELAMFAALRFAYYMDMGRSNYLPWTPLRLYDWFKTNVSAININTGLAPGSVAAACCSAVNGRTTITTARISNDVNRQYRLTPEGLAALVALLAHEVRHMDGNNYVHTGCCSAGNGACDQSYNEADLSAYGVQYWLFKQWSSGGVNLGYSCNVPQARALALSLVSTANVYPSRFCTEPPPVLAAPATPGGACIASCNVTLNGTVPPSSPSGGGAFSLAVSASTPACGWTAASPDNWMSVLSGGNNAGAGAVTVNVAPNLGAPRSGSVVVAGMKFPLTEAGAACAPTCALPPGTQLRLARGFRASGPANNLLPLPVKVELLDAAGNPLGGIPVTLTATNATVTPANVTTDEEGAGAATVRLGPAVGSGRISATVPGLPALNIDLSVVAAAATSFITSVNTAWGGNTIAQNTFIEIKGANLVPATTPPSGVIWSTAPEFAQGRMPTVLAGVSVTVNRKPAFVYFYCSRATSSACAQDQINVLTPLDSATGSVNVVVTNQGAATPAFPVEMKAVAPTFLLFSPQGYAVATHADYRLTGPATLYPGATTPAAVGETVLIYAVGFGLPASTLVNGSSTQSGLLPQTPVCFVNRAAAAVTSALIAPGLYQLNLTVPAGARNGDNSLDCIYGGVSTFTGALLSVVKP